MVKWKQASALLYFVVDLQFGVLSQKEQHDSCPLAGDYMTIDYVLGDIDCTVGVSPFAPPTHD